MGSSTSQSLSDPNRLEVLICGYLTQQTKSMKLFMSMPQEIATIVNAFYPLLPFKFGDFKQNAFEVNEDRTRLIGGDKSCNGYLVYADLQQYNDTGLSTGTHFWSIRCSNDEQSAKRVGNCYNSIGVTTQKNMHLINTDHERHWIHGEENHSFMTMCFEDNQEIIITIKLDCNNWTVTYHYHYGSKVYIPKIDRIQPHKSYYLAMMCCGESYFTDFEVVEPKL